MKKHVFTPKCENARILSLADNMCFYFINTEKKKKIKNKQKTKINQNFLKIPQRSQTIPLNLYKNLIISSNQKIKGFGSFVPIQTIFEYFFIPFKRQIKSKSVFLFHIKSCQRVFQKDLYFNPLLNLKKHYNKHLTASVSDYLNVSKIFYDCSNIEIHECRILFFDPYKGLEKEERIVLGKISGG